MTVTEQTPGGSTEDTPLLNLLSGFIVELRQAGLPVSLTENLDALEAVTHNALRARKPRTILAALFTTPSPSRRALLFRR